MKKRFALALAIGIVFLLVSPALTPVFARDTWTSVRSKNFQLVGNASEKDIRRVAVRLEQFREVFSRLFTSLKISSPIPTTVIVFKNDRSYRPFKLTANTAGYFQPGPDVNYITFNLANETRSQQDAFNVIFHEYTHLLVKNTIGTVPTWFNEGLAEYYSTFSMSDDQKVVMGRAIESHVHLLRKARMLPLRTLFEVDQQSPFYNERDKQSLFYAESWALIHFLILGNDGKLMQQMTKFLELLSASLDMEQAFQQAFAMNFESMQKQLRNYVDRESYPILNGSFNGKISYDTAFQSALLNEAEVNAYLGDLLLHCNRDDSEGYLQKALAIDPNLPMANASMGMLRLRQDKHEEASKSFERALAASNQSYLIHYYYAYVLSLEGRGELQPVVAFAPEIAARMRAELKTVIALRPDFPESYSLLALVSLVTGTEIDETLELVRRAFAVFPGRNDIAYKLAQLYLHKQDFKAARQLIERLGSCSDEGFRNRSQILLTYLVRAEEIAREPVLVENYDPAVALRETLRRPAAGEAQTQGRLARIDCDKRGLTFIIRTDDRLLKLGTDSFQHVRLVSFSEDAHGQVTCGVRKPENNVVVSYLPSAEGHPKFDGVLKSVEFVPPDFTLTTKP